MTLRYVFAALLAVFAARGAEDRNAKVIADKAEVQEGGFWIYDDLPKGRELARVSGKPLLVVLRCIP